MGKSEFDKQSDSKIWDEFRQGNQLAFDYIFEQYLPLLYKYGSKITEDGDFLEDCLQDLFVELWERKSSLGKTDSIKFYLFSSLRRKIIRKLDKEKKLAKTAISENYHFEMAFSLEAKIITNESQQKLKKQLDKALQELSPRQKEAIYLRYFDGLSYEEIAGMMSITVNATYKLISTGVSVLRKFIKKTYLFCLIIPVSKKWDT